ncbi:twin-arginine translocation signal domain-containing protein, partial [Pseudomonas gingeri]
MTILLSRRDFLGYSVTVGGGLLLAGCGPNDTPAGTATSDQPRY